MTFDIAELQIHADPQVAFAHYLCHCGGTGPDGQPHSSWMRVSAGYRKHGDGWKVIHEHFSAPFDMERQGAVRPAALTRRARSPPGRRSVSLREG